MRNFTKLNILFAGEKSSTLPKSIQMFLIIWIICYHLSFSSRYISGLTKSSEDRDQKSLSTASLSIREWLLRAEQHRKGICPVKIRQFSKITDWWIPNSQQLLVNTFPIDPEEKADLRRVKNALFSRTNTTPFEGLVSIAAWSENVLINVLDLDSAVVEISEFVEVFSGKMALKGTTPLTHRYGGHQFGVWADQLGDGRAHMIGEYTNQHGQRYELNLKGSGKTPYSRNGDGRAIVRSSVREFLASEAMFHLGIPTSRCATLITATDTVKRDLLYDGKLSDEKTAIVLRLAPSWFRFGSAEILAKHGELNILRQLLDFVIESHFKEITLLDSTKYLELFSTIVQQTAEMIAMWQATGFVHGVGNTDNFSLLSMTIDYGPFQFMDSYDPELVSNASDDEGRYSYRNQPKIGRYNLDKLAESLKRVLNSDQHSTISIILDGYDNIYRRAYYSAFCKKLGLQGRSECDNEQLVVDLLKMMEDTKADFTMTFRQLGDVPINELETNVINPSHWALLDLQIHPKFIQWMATYHKILVDNGIVDEVRRTNMHRVNPKYVLRNWMAEDAIAAVKRNDYSVIRKLLHILQNPFEDQIEADILGYASRPPKWSSTIRVSCAS